jgi:cell division septation protein DedD
MVDEQEGVSTRQLLAAFFAVVVLCAVFFSLGFFLGHQGRSPQSTLATEQVPSSSSDAPPTVNAPDQAASSDASAGPPAGASSDQGTAAAGAPVTKASPGSSAGPSTAENSAASGTPEAPAPVAASPAESVTGQTPAQPANSQQVALHTTVPAAPGPVTPGRVPPGPLVQVAALTNQQDANDMVGVLQSRGYQALILTPQQAHATDNLFRVVAGPYKSRAEAEEARRKLAAAGFKPFIR